MKHKARASGGSPSKVGKGKGGKGGQRDRAASNEQVYRAVLQQKNHRNAAFWQKIISQVQRYEMFMLLNVLQNLMPFDRKFHHLREN